MRELDMLLLRYVERDFPTADPQHKTAFGRLLNLQDPEILALLTEKVRAEDPELHALVQCLLGRSGDTL